MYTETTIQTFDATERAILHRAFAEIEEHRKEQPECGVAESDDEGAVMVCAVPEPRIEQQPEMQATAAIPVDGTEYLDTFTRLAAQAGIPQTIALLRDQFGAARASDVPVEQRAQFLAALAALQQAAA